MKENIDERNSGPARKRNTSKKRRLATALNDAVLKSEWAIELPSDMALEDLLDQTMIPTPTSVRTKISIDGVPISVIAVPDSIWHEPVCQLRLKTVRQRMRAAGRSCSIVSYDMLLHTPDAAMRAMLVRDLVSYQCS